MLTAFMLGVHKNIYMLINYVVIPLKVDISKKGSEYSVVPRQHKECLFHAKQAYHHYQNHRTFHVQRDRATYPEN